jgi:hypothetical protein
MFFMGILIVAMLVASLLTHILREPQGSLYKSHRVASSPETISPLIAPQGILDLHDLFVGL